MVDYELRIHFGDEGKFTFADLGGFADREIRPCVTGFSKDETDVLRAFFHLASKIQRRRTHKKRVRPSDFHLGVESPDVHLCSSKSLLTNAKASGQLRHF